jgi:hypothetical protein
MFFLKTGSMAITETDYPALTLPQTNNARISWQRIWAHFSDQKANWVWGASNPSGRLKDIQETVSRAFTFFCR